MMNKSPFLLLIFLLFLQGCYRGGDIDPSLHYALSEEALLNLPSAFSPMEVEELKEDGGKEFLIAQAFAKQLDLYRAISTFKRAEILQKNGDWDRKLEAQYDILFCYYLGKKYPDVIRTFEKSDLPYVDKTFPAFHDLLLSLYESYGKENNQEKFQKISHLIQQSYPVTFEKLHLATALMKADFPEIQKVADQFPNHSYLDKMLENYQMGKKSIRKAQVYNALLPGSGYLYLGQKRSAITAFLLNSLFISAAYHFFHKGQIAAGIITTSFEMGWYFGGIYGAGEGAKFYNERLYEKEANNVMQTHQLYPALMLEHAF